MKAVVLDQVQKQRQEHKHKRGFSGNQSLHPITTKQGTIWDKILSEGAFLFSKFPLWKLANENQIKG